MCILHRDRMHKNYKAWSRLKNLNLEEKRKGEKNQIGETTSNWIQQYTWQYRVLYNCTKIKWTRRMQGPWTLESIICNNILAESLNLQHQAIWAKLASKWFHLLPKKFPAEMTSEMVIWSILLFPLSSINCHWLWGNTL